VSLFLSSSLPPSLSSSSPLQAYKVHIGEGHEWHHRLHVFAGTYIFVYKGRKKEKER